MMLARYPAQLPLTQRWHPPSWPDTPTRLNPSCTLAREFAAYRTLQDERTVPASAELVALRDQVAHFEQIASDPDSSAADAWSAERALRTLQPELDRAEDLHAAQQRERLKQLVQTGQRWQQTWQHALELRREYEQIARALYAESLGSWHGTRGPDRPSQRLVRLKRDMEAQFGPLEWYDQRMQEGADAVA